MHPRILYSATAHLVVISREASRLLLTAKMTHACIAHSLFFLLLSVLLPTPAVADNESPPADINSGWYYHLGDLPRSEATHHWLFNEGIWRKTHTPNELDGRAGEQIAWLKVRLPEGPWRDPYLFINSIDLTAQVFWGDEMIYAFGTIDSTGQSSFAGWPWHMIHLPENYAEKPIYFRVYSNYPFIGPSGEIRLGNHFDLMSTVLQRGLTGLALVLVMLLAGILTCVMGSIKGEYRVALTSGGLSFNLALMMFAENELSQLALNAPLFWRYVAAFTYFLIPCWLTLLIRAWLRDKTPSMSGWVLGASLIFVAGVALLSAFTPFSFINAYPYFDGLFIVLVLLLILGCSRHFASQGTTGLLMAFGIICLFIALFIDMLSANGFIPFIGRAGQWGLVLFALAALAVYLVKDRHQQATLRNMAHTLENQVQERTAELRAREAELNKLARQDYLTKLLNRRSFSELATREIANAIRFNRPISLVFFDLDHFKDINDQFGHSTGDRVLRTLADITRDICREGEMICRYGGEEFVILLHATDSHDAQALVQRLQKALTHIEIDPEQPELKVTASFGVICINQIDRFDDEPEDLLNRLLTAADHAMYEVKVAGRDGLQLVELRHDSPHQPRLKQDGSSG